MKVGERSFEGLARVTFDGGGALFCLASRAGEAVWDTCEYPEEQARFCPAFVTGA